MAIEQLIARDVPPKKSMYKNIANKMWHVYGDSENLPLNEYLQGIAQNFNWNKWFIL